MATHIGTSGWSYRHWKGRFYPAALPLKQWLPYYLEHFKTTELNNSFYRWPTDRMFAAWTQKLPPGFLMSVKAARILTHFKKLQDPGFWITRMSQGVALLREHLGVLLVQLPPNFAPDADRLEGFLTRMPAWIRVAVEFRHPGWHTEETFSLLERYHASYCIMHGGGLPTVLRVTAPFVYVRLHGPDSRLYGGSYPDEQLAAWADHIRAWEGNGHDVFVYFNNDQEAYAPRNAETLLHMLQVPSGRS